MWGLKVCEFEYKICLEALKHENLHPALWYPALSFRRKEPVTPYSSLRFDSTRREIFTTGVFRLYENQHQVMHEINPMINNEVVFADDSLYNFINQSNLSTN